jgi:hypothetical protein
MQNYEMEVVSFFLGKGFMYLKFLSSQQLLIEERIGGKRVGE